LNDGVDSTFGQEVLFEGGVHMLSRRYDVVDCPRHDMMTPTMQLERLHRHSPTLSDRRKVVRIVPPVYSRGENVKQRPACPRNRARMEPAHLRLDQGIDESDEACIVLRLTSTTGFPRHPRLPSVGCNGYYSIISGSRCIVENRLSRCRHRVENNIPDSKWCVLFCGLFMLLQ